MRNRFWVRVLRDVAGGEGGGGGAAGGEGGAAGGDTLLGGAGGEGGEGGAAGEAEAAAAAETARVAAETEAARVAALTPEQKAAEEAAAAQKDLDAKGAPEKYEALKLPEGVVMPEAFQEAFTPIAKELGLSQAKAQLLFDGLVSKVQPIMLADQAAKWETQKQTWATESRADKEFGGDAFAANSALAIRAVNTFGTPEFKAALNQFGLGNHPEMVRFMVKVGKAMSEDTLGKGKLGGSEGEPKTEEQVQRTLYPTMFKQQ
jgi:hypothetical protein